MIKIVGVYSLPEGTDHDEFWKYHTEAHAVDWRKIAGPELKKYVINRSTIVHRGEPLFYGMVESWWENKQAFDNCIQKALSTITSSGNNILHDFSSRVTNGFVTYVEEKQIPFLE